MAEIKGYTCDGGCGATTVTETVLGSIQNEGWFTTFTPSGWPTLHTCSASCLVRALRAFAGGSLDRRLRGEGTK